MPFPEFAPGYDRPPKDQMEAGMAAALKQLMLDIEAESGWDVPHSLWILYRDELAPRNPLGIQVFELEFKRLHLWTPEQMKVEGPWRIILTLAKQLKDRADITQAILPPNLIGWAFAYEAFGAFANKTNPGETEQLDADAQKRQIKNRPDRMEMRGISAVDRSERKYGLMKLRGEDEVVTRVTDPEEDTGMVEKSLLELIRAC